MIQKKFFLLAGLFLVIAVFAAGKSHSEQNENAPLNPYPTLPYSEFIKAGGIDLLNNIALQQDLREKTEIAKKTLSSSYQARII